MTCWFSWTGIHVANFHKKGQHIELRDDGCYISRSFPMEYQKRQPQPRCIISMDVHLEKPEKNYTSGHSIPHPDPWILVLKN